MFEAAWGFFIFLVTLIIGYFMTGGSNVSSDCSDSNVSSDCSAVNVSSDCSAVNALNSVNTRNNQPSIQPTYDTLNNMLCDFINLHPGLPVVIIGKVDMKDLPDREYIVFGSATHSKADVHANINIEIAENLPECILIVLNSHKTKDSDIVLNLALEYMYLIFIKSAASLMSFQLPTFKQSRSEFNAEVAKAADDFDQAKEFDVDFLTNYRNQCTCFYDGPSVSIDAGSSCRQYLYLVDQRTKMYM
jgi:hypothetical protein